MRALVLVVLLLGCGSDAEATPECRGARVGEACVALLPACKGDEIVRDGACVRVGVLRCAAGFVADAEEGCKPVLPDAPCTSGEVAWLGDAACHPIVDCGSDRYGSPPTTLPLLYVDATGDDANDGSRDKPFKTIRAAVARAASTKHTIAIAEGTYDEELVLDRDVELWGRCPQKVTVAPTTGTNPYAIGILGAAVAIRRLGVAGRTGGIVALDTVKVTVEDSWVHDTGDAGLGAQGDRLEGALVARRVLVERARDFGVFALGGSVTLEGSIVRGTRSAPGNVRGYGVGAENSIARKKSGAVVVRGSIVEKNREVNVFAIGSSATVEGSLLRDTVEGATEGFGVWVTEDVTTMLPTTLRIADSVIARSIRAGVHAVGSTAEIVNTAIVHTASNRKGNGGYCYFAERSKSTLCDSLCRDGRQIGVQISGGSATIERVSISDLTPNDAGQGGIGIVSVPRAGPVTLDLLDSAIARVADAGMLLAGSEITLRGCAIRDVRAATHGFGDGIDVVPWPLSGTWVESTANIASTVVERVERAGIAAFGATSATVSGVRLECMALALIASDRRGKEEPALGPLSALTDGGGSYCGCGKELRACSATVDSLAPVTTPD